ncbi:MAG: hypothetical protein ABIH24_01230 [Verrucomicrobiota bacterium]
MRRVKEEMHKRKCKMQKSESMGRMKEGNTRRSSFGILPSAFCLSSRGQALAEYVIIAGLLMASLGILTVFFVTFKEYSGRILALVSSEYP